MQGCMFYQLSKQCAPGSIFNLMGCWMREKFCLTALCESTSCIIPSNSISQSSKTVSDELDFIIRFGTFNLFAGLALLFPAIDFDHHKLYCR